MRPIGVCKEFIGVLYFATLHFTDFDVQHNCLLQKLFLSPLPQNRMWSCCTQIESAEASKETP